MVMDINLPKAGTQGSELFGRTYYEGGCNSDSSLHLGVCTSGSSLGQSASWPVIYVLV